MERPGSGTCGGARLSDAELEALANRIGAVLRSQGLVRGDHVASLFGNRPEALTIGWAAWRSGLYLTPMSTALTATELRYPVENRDARLVSADAELGDAAAPLPTALNAGLRWLSLHGETPGVSTRWSPCSPRPRQCRPPRRVTTQLPAPRR